MATVPDTTPPIAPKLITDTNYNWTVDPQITMTTNYGTVVIELQPQQAPITVANMLAYVDAGFYTNAIFHRVISNFMIQAGLAGSDGYIRDPIYSPIILESNNGLSNLRGTIAMARTDSPNSASSQFFINQVDNAFLNYSSSAKPGYAVFGKVLSGLDVVDKIAIVPTHTVGSYQNVPVTSVIISSINQTTAGFVTSSGKFNVTDIEQGASWEYTIDGGSSWLSGSGSSFIVPLGNYFANSIEVRQTDSAGNVSASLGKFTSALLVENHPPTIGNITDVVRMGNEDTTIPISFSDLSVNTNSVDVDGTVTAFVIKSLLNGTLLIGTSLETAIPWDVNTNNIVDATHQAYWTPDKNSSGIFNAFKVVAQDNFGLNSGALANIKVRVLAVNDAPVLAQLTDLNYIDTRFSDSYSVIKGVLKATDIEKDLLNYGLVGGVDNKKGGVSISSDYGTLLVNKKTGAYIFTPNKEAIEVLTTSVIDSFTITVSDAKLTDTKSLYINITQQDITESNGDDVLQGTLGKDKFNGLAGNDSIDGGVGADTLIGGLGADTLIGGLGADSLIGGSGDDVYFVDNAGDKVIEKVGVDEGDDTVKSTISYNLGPNLENLTLLGDVKINAKGNSLSNLLIGNAQANKISGGSGNDTISSGAGNDTVLGGVGDDSIFGENGDDTLTGDAGNDLIVGGDGKDVLKGGAGSDIFWFDATPNATTNVDTLTDFVSGTDKLHFSLAVLPELSSTGNFTINDARFISNTTGFAEAPENRFVYNSNTGTLYYDADGSGSSALPVALELLGAHKFLSATDIIVVSH